MSAVKCFFFLISGRGNIDNYMAARACARAFPHFFSLSHMSRFETGGTSFGEKSERAIQSPALFFFFHTFVFTLQSLIPTRCMGFFCHFSCRFILPYKFFFLQGVVINAGNEWCFLKLPRTFTPLLKSNLLS